MCSIDDGETSDVWCEVVARARKPHKCGCCKRVVLAGEQYLRHRSLYDGSWSGEKMCLACCAAREYFASAPGHCSMQPSSFYDMLHECVDAWDKDDPWRPLLNALERRSGRVVSQAEDEDA